MIYFGTSIFFKRNVAVVKFWLENQCHRPLNFCHLFKKYCSLWEELYLDCCILGYDTMKSCRWLLSFQRKFLKLSCTCKPGSEDYSLYFHHHLTELQEWYVTVDKLHVITFILKN
jgi:hypothetical protein